MAALARNGYCKFDILSSLSTLMNVFGCQVVICKVQASVQQINRVKAQQSGNLELFLVEEISVMFPLRQDGHSVS